MPSQEAAVTPLNNVEYLAGTECLDPQPLPFFAADICDFISQFSRNLAASPYIRQMPDLAAVAFWARGAHLKKLRENYPEADYRLGRGLCFHIAPANIPVNFMFSLLFGLLAGNANLVRAPSRNFPQITIICEIMNKTLQDFPALKKKISICRYPRDNDITAAFSAMADCRMIWGGDSTVRLVKSMPTKPRCLDLTFPDRYSIASINGEAILQATSEQLSRLSADFYNDTYLMDQNACSSPRIIFWLNSSKDAREIFWQNVVQYAQTRYNLQAAQAVEKYSMLCEAAINLELKQISNYKGNLLNLAELARLTEAMPEGSCGLFYEYSINDISEISEIVSEKYQTLSYYGLNKNAIAQALIETSLPGIDRIVPVGKALDIDVFWDGHDILRELSRVVSIS